jgi:hypothetical protein
MIVLLNLVDKFSKWSNVHLNVSKCNIPAFIHDLQAIPRKRDRDDTLRARLAHVTLRDRPIGSLTRDELLPRGYLVTSLTASLCPDAHLQWTKQKLKMIGKALVRSPLPPHIKRRLLLYDVHSKIAHAHCIMALSPQAMMAGDSVLKNCIDRYGASQPPSRGRDSAPP